MSFYAGRVGIRSGKDAPSTRMGRLSGLTALTIIVREAPTRWARLCRDMPHRWCPVGNAGQLCLRCSQYRRWTQRT